MFDSLAGLKRTHSCGVLRAKDAGLEVVLMGWVQRRRDHGGLIFVDLRDREGITQVVFNPEINPDAHTKAGVLRDEFVLAVRGLVNPRPPEMVNPQLATGEIEVMVAELRILNTAKTPPFELEDYKVDVSEALRLKYRYLDLRRPSVMKNILFRHRAAQVVRQFLNDQGFIEVETPILTKSTPEGARDYLVPSRVQPGQFLRPAPVAPALQAAPDDGRPGSLLSDLPLLPGRGPAGRPPARVHPDRHGDGLHHRGGHHPGGGGADRRPVRKRPLGVEVPRPFPRLTYRECMDRFGLDRPDLRFGLELQDVSRPGARTRDFRQFREVVETRAGWSRPCTARGLPGCPGRNWTTSSTWPGSTGPRAWPGSSWSASGWQSPLAKFFPDGVKKALTDHLGAKEGDIFFFVADTPEVASTALGQLRLHLAQREGLIPEDQYNLLWVTDFPLARIRPPGGALRRHAPSLHRAPGG